MVKVLLVSALILTIIATPIFVISRKHPNAKWTAITIYVLMLIWLLRGVVGVCGRSLANSNLSVSDTIFDSFIHALQTFSLDEEYTSYTALGKTLLINCGQETLAKVYGVVVSILNICAPILGGAVLLNVLSDVFSGLKIKMHPFRHKFVFSELNAASITLAEDLVRNDNYKLAIEPEKLKKKPLIIFTDAYLDNKSESISELFERAKKLGAICIKKDLMHLSLRKSVSIDYFLIDNDSNSNVNELSQLLSRKNVLWKSAKIKLRNASEEQKERNESTIPNARIFVFVHKKYESVMIKNICKSKNSSEYAIVRVIRDYSNMAKNLVYDVPLFLPLLSSQKKQLFVSIIGGGSIAEEVFKTVLWCGQIYDTELNINVFAADVKQFEKKISNECPELLESCRSTSELLRVSPFTEERNVPYCSKLRFENICDFNDLSQINSEILEETDYYIIALGSDSKNISVALDLRRQISRRNLSKEKHGCTVIAPAVFDKEAAEAIQNFDTAGLGPLIIPFGILEKRFSVKNVFMTSFSGDAEKSHKLYSKKDDENFKKDEYTYWANVSREIHVPYKLFGLGLIIPTAPEERGEKLWTYGNRHELTEKNQYELAWIEHRRWNACLRASGFSHPSKAQYDKYYSIHKAHKAHNVHKDLDLKFHPCLVECMEIPQFLPVSEDFDREKYDFLDYAAMYTYHNEMKARGLRQTAEDLKSRSYKQYDFLYHDSALRTAIEKCGVEIKDHARLKDLGIVKEKT